MTSNESHNSLRVLHGIGGAAGQPSCLSRAQAKLGVIAHCMRLGENKFQYPADIIMPVEGHQSYCQAFAACADDYDVFHFYFRPFFYNSMHCGHPMGMDVLALRAAGKAVIVHFRGSEVRLHSVFQEHSPYNYVQENPERIVSKFPEKAQAQYIQLMQAVCSQVLVTDPELKTYCPEAKIVPRAIDLEYWPYVGVKEHNEPPLIIHAPSRRTVKGTEMLMQALGRLQNRGIGFRLQLGENMTHAEAREVYMQEDIVVEQLRIGWYGVLSVEAMALGKPVLAYVREDLRHHLPHPPLVMTSPDTVEHDLETLIADPGRRMELSRRARQYVEEVHDSRQVAAQLVDIYRECLRNPKPVDFEQLGEYINSLPYYLHSKKKIKQKTRLTRYYWNRFLHNYQELGLKATLAKTGKLMIGKRN